MIAEVISIIIIIISLKNLIINLRVEEKNGKYLSYSIFGEEVGNIQNPQRIDDLKVMYNLSSECYDDDPFRQCILTLNNRLIHIYGLEFNYKKNLEVDMMLANYDVGNYIILYNNFYYIARKTYNQIFLIDIVNKPTYL